VIFPSAEKNFKRNFWNLRGFFQKIGFFVQALPRSIHVGIHQECEISSLTWRHWDQRQRVFNLLTGYIDVMPLFY